MFVAKPMKTEHADIIHDVSFDHHGKRMATCSSDQTVKVWDQGKDGKWHCSASWRTHSGSVWRVTWGPPEFGQVLATCSFDRTVAVWEELSKSGLLPPNNTFNRGVRDAGTSTNAWPNKASLVDSRTSVTDVRFGPKHLGLLLATCSADGIVRMYEAVDVMNLSNWQLQHEIAISIGGSNISLSCLSWSNSRIHPPTIAVGSDDRNYPTDPKVFIYRFNDNARKWECMECLTRVIQPVHDVQFAPHLGRSFHLLAVASTELDIFSLKEIGEEAHNTTGFQIQLVGNSDDHKASVWRLAWSVLGNKLASTASDGSVLIWRANFVGQWQCIQRLKANSTMSEIERASIMAGSLSTTPTSSQTRGTPPPGVINMNIKRASGWPLMDIDVDQGKMYY